MPPRRARFEVAGLEGGSCPVALIKRAASATDVAAAQLGCSGCRGRLLSAQSRRASAVDSSFSHWGANVNAGRAGRTHCCRHTGSQLGAAGQL